MEPVMEPTKPPCEKDTHPSIYESMTYPTLPKLLTTWTWSGKGKASSNQIQEGTDSAMPHFMFPSLQRLPITRSLDGLVHCNLSVSLSLYLYVCTVFWSLSVVFSVCRASACPKRVWWFMNLLNLVTPSQVLNRNSFQHQRQSWIPNLMVRPRFGCFPFP